MLGRAGWRQAASLRAWGVVSPAVLWVAAVPVASATPVTVRFQQNADCSAVVRWELLTARILSGRPGPNVWDATVAATIGKTAPMGNCGSPQTVTVEIGGPGGPTRFWLRTVATSGVSVSGSRDAELPRQPPGGPVPMNVAPGGGPRSGDCLSVFLAPVTHPARRSRLVRCTDGDPACDADGRTDGQCSVPVAVCVNSTAFTGECISPGVEAVDVRGADPTRRGFAPEYLELQTRIDDEIGPPVVEPDRCSGAVTLPLPLSRGPFGTACRPVRRKVKVATLGVAGVGPGRDRDKLVVLCLPSAAGC